jgi:site-specific DNA-methyltransferase (adenine-specific)
MARGGIFIFIASDSGDDIMTMAAMHDGVSDLRRTIQFEKNIAQQGDALDLLVSLPDGCSPLVFFDPQHREVNDFLKFGNEGARQKGRFLLPQMSSERIDACHRESERVLAPSGYFMRWVDTFGLCEARHLRVTDSGLRTVDLIAWDSQRMGMGKRSRRRGDYLLILQKQPVTPSNWVDHSIPSRWVEKVSRKIHPHAKPLELTRRLIAAVTELGDLVVDPCAGSFVTMHAALDQGREFIGVDLAFEEG